VFLQDVEFNTVPLALNHNDRVYVSKKAYKTYAESQATALIQAAPINVALVGRVPLGLKLVFPHIGISCRMPDSQGEGFEHLRAQCDILLTMVITFHKIQNLSLSHSSMQTVEGVMAHLRPELLQSVSGLKGFRFVPVRGGETEVTLPSDQSRRGLMYKVLQSAGNLDDLELSLKKFVLLGRASGIAASFLDATVSNNIRRFVLKNARVSEEHLLKALSRWAPKLEELELGEICLTFVRQGWLPFLQLIATMPKLKHLVLREMLEKKSLVTSDVVSIIMKSLTKGSKGSLPARTRPGQYEGDKGGRHYSGRNEVLLGVEELLAERCIPSANSILVVGCWRVSLDSDQKC
jgi:hypothetical protein